MTPHTPNQKSCKEIVADLQSKLRVCVAALDRLEKSGKHSLNPRCSFTGCNCKTQGEIAAAHAQAVEALALTKTEEGV